MLSTYEVYLENCPELEISDEPLILNFWVHFTDGYVALQNCKKY